MSDKDLITFGAAVASDMLSAAQLPVGSTLTKIAESYVAKKRREAADILIAEVAQGYHGPVQFDEHDVDPLVEIGFRLSKAVADGAAKENLKLLAQIIVGQKKHRALDPDGFRKWAGILEQLTRNELLVIGFASKIRKAMNSSGSTVNDFSSRLDTDLLTAGFSQQEIPALYSSVSRTGILVGASAWGGLVYSPSPWLDELGELADIENAVTKKTTA